MVVSLRLARGGSKKRPFYRMVVADVRSPRDGAFIEKLGTYNPLLPKENNERFVFNAERVAYWIGVGAQPTEAVARHLRKAGAWNKKPVYTAKSKEAKLAPRAQARKDAADAAAKEVAASAE